MTLNDFSCRASLVLLAIALAACSDADDQPVATEPVETPAAAPAPGPAAAIAPAAPAVGTAAPTTGGDGSAIRLSALSAAEIADADLQGELGCSFSTTEASPLLIAMGNVASDDPAFGLVRIGDTIERIATPGGFDAMLDGATFSGRGTTIRIALTGPATGGGESPARPATLTFDRADGAQRVFAGRWACGP